LTESDLRNRNFEFCLPSGHCPDVLSKTEYIDILAETCRFWLANIFYAFPEQAHDLAPDPDPILKKPLESISVPQPASEKPL
jgi:hypothetical protein